MRDTALACPSCCLTLVSPATQLLLSRDNALQKLALADQRLIDPAVQACVKSLATCTASAEDHLVKENLCGTAPSWLLMCYQSEQLCGHITGHEKVSLCDVVR